MASGYKKLPMSFDSQPKRSRADRKNAGPLKIIVRDGKVLETPEIIPDTEPEAFARELRMTAPRSERIMWELLEPMGFQHSVPMLGYVLDFYHPGVHLAIEIDGSSHKGRKDRDKRRDRAFRGIGITTWRIWASRVYADRLEVAAQIWDIVVARKRNLR